MYLEFLKIVILLLILIPNYKVQFLFSVDR